MELLLGMADVGVWDEEVGGKLMRRVTVGLEGLDRYWLS